MTWTSIDDGLNHNPQTRPSAAWRTRGATCPPPAAGPTRAWTRTPARSGRTEMGKRKHGRQRLDHERRLARKTRHPRRRPGTTKEQ